MHRGGKMKLKKEEDRRGYRIVWLNEADGLKLHLLPFVFASRLGIGGVRQILFFILCGFHHCLRFYFSLLPLTPRLHSHFSIKSMSNL